MIIYFISALLISFGVFKLGAYATLLSLITIVSKGAVGLALFVAVVLLINRYKGSWRRIKLIGRR